MVSGTISTSSAVQAGARPFFSRDEQGDTFDSAPVACQRDVWRADARSPRIAARSFAGTGAATR